MSHTADTHRALIHLYFLFPKIGHLLEGVDGDEHRADVCLVRLYVKGDKLQRESGAGQREERRGVQWSSDELAEVSVSIEFLQMTENGATVLAH